MLSRGWMVASLGVVVACGQVKSEASEGGDSETTGYMGATVSADGKAVIICYDRTVSHLDAEAQAKAASGGAMAFNTVYCFRVAPPPE